MHLLAARIAGKIGPDFVIEADGLDDESVSLPPAYRIAQPAGVRILGKRPPVRPDGAPDVEFLEEHEYAARDLHDLKRIGKYQQLRRAARFAVQGRAVLGAAHGARYHQRLGGIKSRLSPGSQR